MKSMDRSENTGPWTTQKYTNSIWALTKTGVDPYISERSMDAYISDRSVDPYMYISDWFVNPYITHRSMDP